MSPPSKPYDLNFGQNFDGVVHKFPPTTHFQICSYGQGEHQGDIFHSQHFDLTYSQSSTIYDIIPNAPRLLIDPKNPNPGPHVNGVVGYVSHTSMH